MRHIAIVKCESCGYEGMGKIYAELKDSPDWVNVSPRCPKCRKTTATVMKIYDFIPSYLAELSEYDLFKEEKEAWEDGFDEAESYWLQLLLRASISGKR